MTRIDWWYVRRIGARDWVRPYRMVRRNGKATMVYEHRLHHGLRDMGLSWLSLSAESVC